MEQARVPLVEIKDVGVVYETDNADTVALEGVNLTIYEREFVSLVGPSGCGKSTLLSLIAGLRRPNAGTILVRGAEVRGPSPIVGFVTQQDNLLPWRNASRNIQLGLELQHVPAVQRKAMVDEMLDLVDLRGFGKHFPAQLSGGMRKRVTLARTLVYKPPVLLLDEPFGALDAQLRAQLQDELLRICQHVECTVILVTHDIDEAITLSDRVVMFGRRPGRVISETEIGFARPRQPPELRLTDEYRQLVGSLWALLGSDAGNADKVAVRDGAQSR